MRDKFGVAISVIIALSLLYFIAPMDDIMRIFDKPQNVGEIAGTGITYEDFQAEVNRFTTINEITTGSSVQNEQTQQQIRNAAWQSLLDRYMFFKNCDAAGIVVSDAEVADLFAGDHVSPMIAQNPLFADETGAFSPLRVKEINAAAQNDATLKVYWDYLKSSVRTQQFYSKYASLFSATALDSPAQLAKSVANGNTTADIQLVTIPYGYQHDSTVVVSKDEIKAYYNKHKKEYKQVANRDIEYVVYEVKPSQEDIAQAAASVEGAIDEFASTESLKSFLLKYSDRAYSEYWYRKGELATINADIDNFAFSGAKGVSKVFNANNTYYAARVMKTANVPDSVYVKHILLQGADASKKADSLCAVIAKTPSKFASLVEEYSADKNSQADGQLGNIGWMTQTYMIPGFESVLTAQKNVPFVLKTNYGVHVVEVTKTTAPILKKKVALLVKETLASKETFQAAYAKANQFAVMAAGKYENYRKAVDSLGVYSHPVNNMIEGTDRLGSIENTKEVARWAYENKVGKVSNIITVDNAYFIIATVRGIHKEGYATVKEVASSIKQQLYYEKLAEKKAAEVAEKINGLNDLQAIAEKLGTTVSTQSGVAFSSMTSQGLDPKFIGAVSVAPVDKISAPVAGSIGVYVFKVTGRDTGSFYTEDDAKTRQSQMAMYSSQMIIPVMMQEADVKDNRNRFY